MNNWWYVCYKVSIFTSFADQIAIQKVEQVNEEENVITKDNGNHRKLFLYVIVDQLSWWGSFYSLIFRVLSWDQILWLWRNYFKQVLRYLTKKHQFRRSILYIFSPAICLYLDRTYCGLHLGKFHLSDPHSQCSWAAIILVCWPTLQVYGSNTSNDYQQLVKGRILVQLSI